MISHSGYSNTPQPNMQYTEMIRACGHSIPKLIDDAVATGMWQWF